LVNERFKKVGFGRSSAVFAWLSGLLASQIWVLPKSELVVKCCQDSRGSGSKAKESGATRKRLTPFAADSGFAASGDAPRASKVVFRRRYLACPAAAAKTNRWAAAT
jgi:hypothetical protein